MKIPELKDSIRKFCENQNGSFSIEAVIWLPIFMVILLVMINLSTVFFNESQMLRIVQDANRAHSLGRLESEQETEDYIFTELAYLSSAFTVETIRTGSVIRTTVSVPAVELMPMNLMSSTYDTLTLYVSGQHLIEY